MNIKVPFDNYIQFMDEGIIDILPDYYIPRWEGGGKWSIRLDDTELYNLFYTNKDKWSIIL